MKSTPQWLVERIALGELPPRELEQARARLLAEPDGAQRLAALSAHDAQTLAALPPPAVAAEVKRRAAPTSPASPRPFVFAFAVAVPVLAALLLWVAAGPRVAPPSVPGLEEDGTRLKGLGPKLLVHRQTPGGADALGDGATVRPGDVLQLSYVAAGRPYGVIVSLDATGSVTLHLPEQPGAAAKLDGSGAHALPRAYALDDAPGYERFFLVTADRPFETAQIVDAARALGAAGRTRPLGLPAFLDQTSLAVGKRAP